MMNNDSSSILHMRLSGSQSDVRLVAPQPSIDLIVEAQVDSSSSNSEPMELSLESIHHPSCGSMLPVSMESNTESINPSLFHVPTEVTPERAAALFLLTLQEKYRVSQAAINFAVGSVTSIIEGVCNSIKQNYTELENDIPLKYDDPFASLQTDHQQTNYYQREFRLVVRIANEL